MCLEIALQNLESKKENFVSLGSLATPTFYAPNFEKVGNILISACPYVCLCVYSCSRYRLETSCIDSSWKISRCIFLVFPELSPLVKLRPFDKQGDEIL